MDRVEVFGTWLNNDSHGLSTLVELSLMSDIVLVARADDGQPVSVFGAAEAWPGVWTVWMYATERFNEVWRSVYKTFRSVIPNQVIGRGAHRAECRAHADHGDAHRFIHALGGEREAVLSGFGRDGSVFLVFRWLREGFS